MVGVRLWLGVRVQTDVRFKAVIQLVKNARTVTGIGKKANITNEVLAAAASSDVAPMTFVRMACLASVKKSPKLRRSEAPPQLMGVEIRRWDHGGHFVFIFGG